MPAPLIERDTAVSETVAHNGRGALWHALAVALLLRSPVSPGLKPMKMARCGRERRD